MQPHHSFYRGCEHGENLVSSFLNVLSMWWLCFHKDDQVDDDDDIGCFVATMATMMKMMRMSYQIMSSLTTG